jgi:hypothetical protein
MECFRYTVKKEDDMELIEKLMKEQVNKNFNIKIILDLILEIFVLYFNFTYTTVLQYLY